MIKLNEIKKIIKKGLAVMLGLLLFSSGSFAKTLTVAIFDTGFCSVKAYDATNSVKNKCSSVKKKSFRNHGQWVLDQINLDLKNTKINVVPVIIFDKNGTQKEKYWKKALNYISELKVDVLVLASSFPFEGNKPSLKLPNDVLVFVASGQKGKAIKLNTKLWPQEVKKENVLIIGQYLIEESSKLDAPNSLYKDKTDYYFPGEGSKLQFLKGSSLAVSKAVARALNICKHDINNCLKKNRKVIKLWPLKKSFFEY